MGSQPMCIECGGYHHTENNISCCYKEYTCVCCGDGICEDDVRWVGDNPCCSDCATYCECCDNYEYNDNVRWIANEDRYVCDSCIENYYHYCDECNEYVRDYNCTYVASVSGYVCNSCLEEYYTECSKCGAVFPKNEMVDVVDGETGEVKYYCSECYDELEEETEEAC